jgi:prephenate dehydrogenase
MTKPLQDCSVAVVGLGLMGASLCLDLKSSQLCREVRGVARRTQTVLDAFFAHAVDLATNDLQTGILGADIVILATPVRTIVSTLEEIGPRLWPGALVMDMGSTKADICAAMAHLPAGVQPVGGHPMCGKETAGFEAAECGLYRNATWVLSPLPRTSPEALALAAELAQAVGARPVVLEAARHDRLVASISHLPFLLASALTACGRRGRCGRSHRVGTGRGRLPRHQPGGGQRYADVSGHLVDQPGRGAGAGFHSLRLTTEIG